MNHGLSMAAPEKMQNKGLTSLVITELRQESSSRADKTSKNANCYLTLGIRCCQIHRDVQLMLHVKGSSFPKIFEMIGGKNVPLHQPHSSLLLGFGGFLFFHLQTSKLSFSANNDRGSLGDRCQKHLCMHVSRSCFYYSSSASSVPTCLHYRQILLSVAWRSLPL